MYIIPLIHWSEKEQQNCNTKFQQQKNGLYKLTKLSPPRAGLFPRKSFIIALPIWAISFFLRPILPKLWMNSKLSVSHRKRAQPFTTHGHMYVIIKFRGEGWDAYYWLKLKEIMEWCPLKYTITTVSLHCSCSLYSCHPNLLKADGLVFLAKPIFQQICVVCFVWLAGWLFFLIDFRWWRWWCNWTRDSTHHLVPILPATS